MAKRAKMAGKGKAKGKKTGPSSSDRVIKTRSMDAVLGVQELEIEEAAESMEQYHKENVNDHYDEKILSPGESEQSIRRQSEIRNDFSDWLSIANRTAQDINTGKKVSPPILRSNIVRNLENSFELSEKEVEAGSKKKIKIEFEDIAEEVNYWQPSLVCYVIGANPPVNILEGFVRRLWKEEVVKVGLLAKGIFIIRFQNMDQRDKVMQQGYVFFDRKPMVVKPWNPIDDFTKEEVTNVPTWIQLRGLDIKYWGESSLFKIVSQLGEPLQVDNVTKNRDRLQYPRILIQVSLAQNFPEKIEFIDEFNHEVELEVKYEWIPLVCYNCSGIGHSTKDCRRQEEKQEQSKQVWMPKKKHLDKEPQVDEEGFQMVNKGKKVMVNTEKEETTVQNMFGTLGDEGEIRCNTRGEGDPSSSNG
ncbi:hypothetical protein CsatA_009863 [Cannabis sativa]